MKAFDFDALAVSPDGSRYAVLVRGLVGQSWQVHVGGSEGEPQPLAWAPAVQKGYLARLSLAGDSLLLVEGGSDDDPAKVTLLDLKAEKVAATLRSTAAELFSP
jgi:hypothetical protein